MSMSVGSSISGNLCTETSVSDYRKNALEILEKIKVQFTLAVKEVNTIALQQGAYGIFFTPDKLDRREKVDEGNEFNESATYSVSIVEDPEMYYRDSFRKHNNVALFLGKITPFSGTGEELKKMAHTGNIPLFEDIFTYWFKTLGDEMAFFHQNRSQILVVKEKINEQFILAIKEAHNHASQNRRNAVYVHQSNIPSDVPPLEKNRFEPLNRYTLWQVGGRDVTADYAAEYYPLGVVTLIENREQFKEIVAQSELHDFKEIFDRCSKEMKEMIDRSPVSSSMRCVLL